MVWVGPEPKHLELFGDKVLAKRLARKVNIPVTQGSEGAFGSVEEVEAWLKSLDEKDRLV
jgi:pyruvate carboxylase